MDKNHDIELLLQKIVELSKENVRLKKLLSEHGISYGTLSNTSNVTTAKLAEQKGRQSSKETRK